MIADMKKRLITIAPIQNGILERRSLSINVSNDEIINKIINHFLCLTIILFIQKILIRILRK
jgi:hypothetical protein